jgi:hypothetical protein
LLETSTRGEVVWKGFMQAHEQLIMRRSLTIVK